MSVKFIKSGVCHDSEICMQGLNLLGHSQLIEVDIGSQCGGHGRCGADRVVLSAKDFRNVNPPTEIERIHLSIDELACGMRLGCQTFPNSDGLDLLVTIE